MSSSTPPRPGRWRARLAALVHRLVQRLFLVACGVLLLRLNGAAGVLIGDLAGPVTPEAITIGFARVLVVAVGLWLLYRGLR